jgi:hypothetical protein
MSTAEAEVYIKKAGQTQNIVDRGQMKQKP